MASSPRILEDLRASWNWHRLCCGNLLPTTPLSSYIQKQKMTNPFQINFMIPIGSRWITLTTLLGLFVFLPACATNKEKQPKRPATVIQPLPKPAAMRIAQDTSMNRKPPLLPRTVVNIKPTNGPDVVSSEPISNGDLTEKTTPKFINNEQPQDFFKGAGDAPVGETVLGSFFDNVFRPATPPNQPVSSTSYNVH
jgi:hypothetical protein